MKPASTDSNATVALSVSTSAMESPGMISSPGCFSHFTRLPFSIVGDRAGIVSRMWSGSEHAGDTSKRSTQLFSITSDEEDG